MTAAGTETQDQDRHTVSARGITKAFPGVTANDGVDFDADRGEVHALLGENGSGKTTLCKILTGLYRPDAGDVLVGGNPVNFRSPADAYDAGIF
ncbi:MAG: ATP-binding cassette domain-containing protein, partial [Acidimicrobiia bacterium]|nr:ATP-binding cassette domain-containing protein [Acidimicrobiia bacterium]